jgi:hypothetical protein
MISTPYCDAWASEWLRERFNENRIPVAIPITATKIRRRVVMMSSQVLGPFSPKDSAPALTGTGRPGQLRACVPRVTHMRCTIYIVRRTQLYLDDQLWGALHAHARREKTTISELVRQAVRERYLGDREQRAAAMQRFVGSRKSGAPRASSVQEVRRLRKGTRLDRLADR